MTTHFPRPPYAKEELQALYPACLELTQVHIFLRHGERTPVSQRLGNAGLPGFWPFCSVLKARSAPVLLSPHGPTPGEPATALAQAVYWNHRLETWSHETDSPAQAHPSIRQGGAKRGAPGDGGICESGMLTDRGRETATALGQRLRQLYVRDLGFLPGVLTPSFARDEAYFRSTNVPRALESLLQAIGGLWPSGRWDNGEMHARPASSAAVTAHLDKNMLGWNEAAEAPHGVTPRTALGSFQLDVVTRQTADEDLYPNDWNCRRFAHLSRAFASRAAERWNGTPEMKYLTDRMGKWMPAGEVKLDGKPRLTGLMDTINATKAHDPAYLARKKYDRGHGADKPGWDAFPVGRTSLADGASHGVSLPPEFYDEKAMQFIQQMTVSEWYGGFAESEEYRRLGIGSLMGDVVERMVRGAESSSFPTAFGASAQTGPEEPGQQKGLRFSLNGCHDTTLAAITTSLGAGDGKTWPPFTSHVAIELFRDPTASPTSSEGSQHSTSTTHSPSSTASASTRSTASSEPLETRHEHTGAIEKLEHLFHLHKHSSVPIGRRKMAALSDEEKQRMRGYYVRVRYNDEPMIIPSCRPLGKHWGDDEGLCTLETFKSVVDKFTPENWKSECHHNLGKPEFPVKPEPAGY